MIQELLAQQALELAMIDAFAFASGPGAFTGLRVACSLAQGLAYGCRRPVVAVNSLRALSHAAACGPGRRLMAATDARMGQIYWAVFESGPELQVLAAPSLADPGQLPGLLARWDPAVVAGDALSTFETAWPPLQGRTLLPDLRLQASSVAELASLDLRDGRQQAPRDATPEYVRDRVALTVAQRRGPAAGDPH